MSVKVRLDPILYPSTENQTLVEVQGNTVGECLNNVVTRFPKSRESLFDEENKLLKYYSIFVNGESAFPQELTMPVKDGDEIRIILIVGGG